MNENKINVWLNEYIKDRMDDEWINQDKSTDYSNYFQSMSNSTIILIVLFFNAQMLKWRNFEGRV